MRHLIVLGALAVAGFASGTARPAQAPPPAPQTPGTGFIAGTVIDWSTRKPIAEAVVTVLPQQFNVKAPGIPQRVLTDSAGRFAFAGLPVQALYVRATKASYSQATTNATMELHDAERITDLTLVLVKRASIAGRVLDDLGDPVVGVQVRAHRRTYAAGRPRLEDGTSGRTDDRGLYRIGNLYPGEYVIAVLNTQVTLPIDAVTDWMNAGSATNRETMTDLMRVTSSLAVLGSSALQRVGDVALQSALDRFHPPDPVDPRRAMAYPTTFALSATTTSAATVIKISSGDERTGVDVQLILAPVVAVSGLVIGADGPVPRANLRLMPTSGEFNDGPELATATTLSDAAGRFTFLNVPQGQYRLVARKDSGSRGGLIPINAPWADETVTVTAAPLDSLRVTLHGPVHLTGQLKFDGTSARPKFPPSTVGLPYLILATADARRSDVFSDPSNVPGEFDADTTTFSFATTGGRYVVTGLDMPAPWLLRSVVVDGKDIMQSPIDLKSDVTDAIATFIDKSSSLAGTVRTGEGAAARDSAVMLFPTDSTQWTGFGAFPSRFRRGTTSLAGAYRFARLLGGDYWLVAAIEAPALPTALQLPSPLGDWQHPAFLTAISRSATRVHIDDGETRTVDLKAVSVR